MAQFFGMMPLHNLLEYDVILLEFKLKSWKSVYSIFCIIGTFCNAFSAFLMAYDSKFEFSQLCKLFIDLFEQTYLIWEILAPLIFYTLNFYIMMEFFRLAGRWPRLMRHWERAEFAIMNFRKKNFDRSLSYRMWIVTVIIMICCWSELAPLH